MKLLSFSVGNFLSIRDVQTISFAPNLGKAAAPEGGWVASVQPVSVLLGANASGKTNMLQAITHAMMVIQYSATVWRDRTKGDRQEHRPFLLDADYQDKPSFFEFDFFFDGHRYIYGFEHSFDGVHGEWLSRVPNRRWSTCLDRPGSEGEPVWNETFMSKSHQNELGKINGKELIMSVALRDEHPILFPIISALVGAIITLPLGEHHESGRIKSLIRLIRQGRFELEEISQLMLAADTGVVQVELDEKKIPTRLVEDIRTIVNALSHDAASRNEAESTAAKFSDEQLADLAYSLSFIHRGNNREEKLNLASQSSGTLSWLSIAPSILEVLRTGGVLVADELDSSLHQHLVEMIVRAFTDESINLNKAQLIFTSHNTNLLEHMRDLELNNDSFWFAEKDRYGGSEYYALSDFHKHADANYERRYLSGRYRALPNLSLSILRGLLVESDSVMEKGND